MGYERKRGKLSELNSFLRGLADNAPAVGTPSYLKRGKGELISPPFSLIVGNTKILSDVKYVITLDTDTKLPRDSARQFVGTMAHSLNRVHYDETLQRVVEGYGILQPRVAVSLPGTNRSQYACMYGLTPSGELIDTPEAVRLAAMVEETTPPEAIQLDRVYDGRLRLVAYQLEPSAPQPGQQVKLTFYWLPVKELSAPLHLTVQLADSRSLPLGRDDDMLPVQQWLLSRVTPTEHTFTLPANLDAPLAALVEVGLKNQAAVALRPTTQTGGELEAEMARFTIAPAQWPALTETNPVEAVWQNGLKLTGYTLAPQPARPGQNLTVNLFWQTNQPITATYSVFVHLLDKAGQLKAQNDA